MGIGYLGACSSCHRTAPLRPALGATTERDVWSNLYCASCQEQGRAIYRPYVAPSAVSMVVGAAIGYLLLAAVAAGILGFRQSLPW